MHFYFVQKVLVCIYRILGFMNFSFWEFVISNILMINLWNFWRLIAWDHWHLLPSLNAQQVRFPFNACFQFFIKSLPLINSYRPGWLNIWNRFSLLFFSFKFFILFYILLKNPSSASNECQRLGYQIHLFLAMFHIL